MTTLSLNFVGNPFLSEIATHSENQVRSISEDLSEVTQRTDFIYPLQQTILLGIRSGEYGSKLVPPFLSKLPVRSYASLMDADEKSRGEARQILYQVFHSAREIGKEFRDIRLKNSNSRELETGKEDLIRHFSSLIADSFKIDSSSHAFGKEVSRMYRNNYSRLA